MRKYTSQEEYILDCWHEIYNSYSSESRYYHNLIHINNMISELKNVISEVKEPDALLFSIYYHDIIYSTSNSNNEHRSAMLFEKRIEQTDFQYIDKCKEQIELTKEHKRSEDNDTNILLDLDLTILGKSRIEYLVYCQNIRKEYNMFSDLEYRTGRKKVLVRILDLSSIYKTDHFSTKYEENARINLTYELNSLV